MKLNFFFSITKKSTLELNNKKIYMVNQTWLYNKRNDNSRLRRRGVPYEDSDNMAAPQNFLPKMVPSQGAILFSIDADTQDSRTMITVKKRLEQQTNHMTIAGSMTEGSYSKYLVNYTKQKSCQKNSRKIKFLTEKKRNEGSTMVFKLHQMVMVTGYCGSDDTA